MTVKYGSSWTESTLLKMLLVLVGFFYFLLSPPLFIFLPYGLLWERAGGRVVRAAIPQEGFGGEILRAEAVSCHHPPGILPRSLPPLGRGR